MPSLTRAEAAARAQLLRVDRYEIELDLDRGPEVFRSTTTVRFRAGSGAGTFLDLKPRTLHTATLNGRGLDPAELVDGRLPLTGLADENVLTVDATMAYTNSGQGLHRFVDPADGLVYLYGAMFLDEAGSVFACFEQPDLKAPLELRVTAPPQWTVVANGPGRVTRPGRWTFEPTRPLATYLVTLVAGPYHGVHTEHDGIPLSLYARRSRAAHLDRDAPDLFATTRACLDRYHELFGVRYPFGKYDQAFVPEFNAGAMENPGCVTFRDEFLYRSAATPAERELRAIVIAHEMAHMWFGDYVTMRWWDDIWLNESFAEYFGHRVAAEVTGYPDTWASFAAGRKLWGYAADQRPSAHPVSADVPDAAQALLNFDGISYAKGAAILRQLAAWLGDDVFLAGLRAYFARHADGNATLADLLAALGRASGRDLTDWAGRWLRASGVNTLTPEIRAGAVAVTQEGEPPRPHHIGIGWYATSGARRAYTTLELTADVHSGQTPVPDGVSTEDTVLLNDGDLSYAKVRLADWAALPELLPRAAEPLTRAVLWAAAWEAVRDALLPAQYALELAERALPGERHTPLLEEMLLVLRDFAVARYLPPAEASVAAERLAVLCEELMRLGDHRQLSAARAFIGYTVDSARLHDWLAGRGLPAGLSMDVELRWAVLGRLATLGELTEVRITEEYDRDRGAAGAEHAARCRAALPTPEAKGRAWDALTLDGTLSNGQLYSLADGFWQPGQEELTASYVDRYGTEMPAMARHRPSQLVRRLAGLAYPRLAVHRSTLEMSQRLLSREDLTPALRRAVVDATDELRRSLAARARADGGTG